MIRRTFLSMIASLFLPWKNPAEPVHEWPCDVWIDEEFVTFHPPKIFGIGYWLKPEGEFLWSPEDVASPE